MLKKMLEVVDYYKNQIKDDGNVYFYDNLPEKKLNNALSSYLVLEPNEKCLAFVDDTFFGSGKEGIVITNLAIYTKDVATEPMRFRFLEIKEAKKSGLLIDDISIDGVKIKDFTQTSKKSIKLLTELINDLIKVVKQENLKFERDRAEQKEKHKLEQEKKKQEKEQQRLEQGKQKVEMERQKLEQEKNRVASNTQHCQKQKRKIDNSSDLIKKYKLDSIDNTTSSKNDKQSEDNQILSIIKSAEQGNAKAQFELGGMYIQGYGVEEDAELAFEWFEKSALQGNAEAQSVLEALIKKANA